MRLTLTVRYGYDEELIFAQQLGADAVIMRLPVEASSAPAAAHHRPAAAGSMPPPAATGSSPLAAVAYRAAACGLPLAGVELTGMPQDAGAWTDTLRSLLDSAAAAGVRRIFCAPPGCAPVAPESGAPDLAVTAHAPVRSTAPSRSRNSTAGSGPAPVMGRHLATILAGVAPVAAGAGVDIVVPGDRAALERNDKFVPGLRLEWVVGTTPGGAEVGPADPSAGQVSADTMICVRFDGGGRLLADSSLDVPRCALALAAARYRGLLRAGTPPRLADDDDWNPKGAAADLGYLRAVVQSIAAGRP